MNDNMNLRCVPLDTLDLWVQVHDVLPGIMSDRFMQEIGNQVGRYVGSCPSNYKGIWREYMRIRVTIDITKTTKKEDESSKDWKRMELDHIQI